MKVIDLLNKIANGETPKEIKYDGYTYIYNEKNESYERSKQSGTYLCWDYIVFNELNAEVEIVDKERFFKDLQDTFVDIEEKINEIIDYLKTLER